MTMSEPIDFARVAAELEGDATVGAGATRSSYAKRFAAVPARATSREDLAQRFDHELDELLDQLRATLHEAWTTSVPVHSSMDLELSPLEGHWRLRLVEKRGSELTRLLATSQHPAAADAGRQ